MVQAETVTHYSEHYADIKPLAPIAIDGFVASEGVATRRSDLQQILSPRNTVEAQRDYVPGAVVLIPIHNDAARIATVQHAIESIAQQGKAGLTIAIADNGLSSEGARSIRDFAATKDMPVEFIDATPQSSDQKNPAFARNKGLKGIRQRSEHDPRFRTEGILLMDSDTALLPGALELLEKTYRNNEGTVAVTARNVSVPSLDTTAYAQYLTDVNLQTHRERVLPTLFTNGRVDIASIIAFGSDVAIKTCGVYIDRSTIEKIGEKPFVRMPNGSAEDMMFSTAISQFGTIRHNPNAVVLDLARETQQQLRQQRANWGRDHTILFSDLAAMGYVTPGLHVLEPHNGVWEEWVAPHTEQVTGYIINPEQLKMLQQALRQNFEAEGPHAYGTTISKEQVLEGTEFLNKAIAFIDKARPFATRVSRIDLPHPTEAPNEETRFSPDSLQGLLAGNIQGMYDIQAVTPGVTPKTFFFGVRQASA